MKNLTAFSCVLLILAAVGLACSAFDNSGSNTNEMPANSASPDSTPAADAPDAATTAGTDPKGELMAASTRFTKLPSFRAHMTGQGESTVELTLEYQAPDRFRIKTEPIRGVEIESVMIGRESWVKIGDEWQKNEDAEAKVPALPQILSDDAIKNLKNARFVGVENLNGKEADKYSYDMPANAEQETGPFKAIVWVEKATGLPMKVAVDYEKGSLKSATITYDTDARVKIEKPK